MAAPQRHLLTHGDPESVLTAVRGLWAEVCMPGGEDAEETGPGELITRSLEYLEKRVEQLQDAPVAAQGYPRGSVESVTKRVIEARLKGAGMRWARPHVTPLVALRTMACSDRWAEAWPQITAHWHARRCTRRRDRAAQHQQRQTPATAPQARPEPAAPPATPTPCALGQPRPVRRAGPRRPAATHPWRHRPIGRPRCA